MALTTGSHPAQLFSSFWLGGFESGCQISRSGTRLDMICATEHDIQCDADYALVRTEGITTVRDAVRWHLIDRAGQYDFSSLAPMVEAAERHNVQVIWSLCHYGWPDDVDILTPAFVDRFARFAEAIARFMREHSDGVPYYTPINEPSFLAWAAGEGNYFYPFAREASGQIKRQLARAAIAGMEAIWAVDPRARFVHVDPLIHVTPPLDMPKLADTAERARLAQFEFFDMLAGRVAPDLGGQPRYLDILGANFYHNSQWEYLSGYWLGWSYKPLDIRWRPFSQMLGELYRRYHRPVFISETSHFGDGRAAWLDMIVDEVLQAWDDGTPVGGLCLYPIIDRLDWDRDGHWHNSGLWDIVREEDGRQRRVLCAPYAEAVRRGQRRLAEYQSSHLKAA